MLFRNFFLMTVMLFFTYASAYAKSRKLENPPSTSQPTCKIWATNDDDSIISRVWSECPCHSRWDSRSSFLHCVESSLNNLRSYGVFGGSLGKKFWFDRFKYQLYPESKCGPIFPQGDPRHGVFYNYGRYHSPPLEGRTHSSSSGGNFLYEGYVSHDSLLEEREVTALADVTPTRKANCQLWYSVANRDAIADMISRCPCDGLWESRSFFLHGCVEKVINEAWINKLMWGEKVSGFWYNEFKYNYFLNNKCGYLFSNVDHRYGTASSAVR